jgi:hypothetical protein
MSETPPVPKRGAFPTPKEVRDKAPRYIPDDDAAKDQHDKADRSPDPAQPEDNRSDTKDTDK